MKKIVNKLIDECVVGVDTYSHNGSTWLIFTESKQWVIELTESKTLWYNYNFFKGMFPYVSMDVVENQSYITQWVEDNIINKVEHTSQSLPRKCSSVEDIIQNGVRHIDWGPEMNSLFVDDALENGIKETRSEINITEGEVDDIIQDGVKHTARNNACADWEIEDTIQNGVKLTQFNDNENKSWVEGVIKKGVKRTFKQKLNVDVLVKEIIQDGVKETNHVDVMGFFNNKMEDALQNGVRHTLNTEYMPTSMVEDIIENGIKETKTPGNGDIVSTVEWLKENNSTSYPKMIDDVIDNGVKKTMLRQHITDGNVEIIIETGIKEVQPLPDQSGELIGYGNYYHGKEDRAKAFIDYIEETIKFGVKES